MVEEPNLDECPERKENEKDRGLEKIRFMAQEGQREPRMDSFEH